MKSYFIKKSLKMAVKFKYYYPGRTYNLQTTIRLQLPSLLQIFG